MWHCTNCGCRIGYAEAKVSGKCADCITARCAVCGRLPIASEHKAGWVSPAEFHEYQPR